MIHTSLEVGRLADRIEYAYLRRYPHLPRMGSDERLWESLASMLIRAHERSPWLPVDPELFIASQLKVGPLTDPWAHLESSKALRRYRRKVRRIILALRVELRQEIRLLQRTKVRVGSILGALEDRPSSVSALACYIFAIRARRAELAEVYRRGAQEQHSGCPLYQRASQTLIRAEDYPVLDLFPGVKSTPRIGPLHPTLSLN